MRQNIFLFTFFYFTFQSFLFPNINKSNRLYSKSFINQLKTSSAPMYVKVVEPSQNLIRSGILFTYKSSSHYRKQMVEVCMDLSIFRCFVMNQNKKGLYYLILPLMKQSKYVYKFRVDGIYTDDKMNQHKIEDGYGSFFSVYYQENIEKKQPTVEILKQANYETSIFYKVIFRIQVKNAKNISLLGDFNHWELNADILQKKEGDIFEIVKELKKGEYLYYFYVDGKRVLDLYNPEVRYKTDTQETLSYIKVEEKKQ